MVLEPIDDRVEDLHERRLGGKERRAIKVARRRPGPRWGAVVGIDGLAPLLRVLLLRRSGRLNG